MAVSEQSRGSVSTHQHTLLPPLAAAPCCTCAPCQMLLPPAHQAVAVASPQTRNLTSFRMHAHQQLSRAIRASPVALQSSHASPWSPPWPQARPPASPTCASTHTASARHNQVSLAYFRTPAGALLRQRPLPLVTAVAVGCRCAAMVKVDLLIDSSKEPGSIAYLQNCHCFTLSIAKYPCIQIKYVIYESCLYFHLLSQYHTFIQGNVSLWCAVRAFRLVVHAHFLLLLLLVGPPHRFFSYLIVSHPLSPQPVICSSSSRISAFLL
ncbi:hypothetical protein VPH35_059630 [Triticum aestivum]